MRPGDRRIVSVAPHPRAGERTWSCSRCGRSFPVGASWDVTYRHHDGAGYVFVVCEVCAYDLAPVRVTLDLTRLEAEADLDLAPLVSVARFVLAARDEGAPAPTDLLNLRYADLHLLAEMFELTPSELESELRRRGVVRPE